MKPAIFALPLLCAFGMTPAAAQEAPRLVEYFESASQSPIAGGAASELSQDGSETLATLHDDPSAVDVRVGQVVLESIPEARALSIDLPSPTVTGAELLATFENLEITYRSDHDYSVYGRNTTTGSEVSLTVMGQDVVGTVRHGDEVYELRPLGGGITAVYRRDTSQWKGSECGVTAEFLKALSTRGFDRSGAGPATRPPAASRPDTRAPAVGGDGAGEVVDVLVAYTPGARSGAGNIDALVRNFIDDTNRFFLNSRIRTRVRLAHSYETDYRQSGEFRTDLQRLALPDDRYMDEAHERRERFGADLVALIVNRFTDYCGVANLYHGRESGGFSVNAQSCGSYTFAHELGHNFGAHHNPAQDTNRGYPYGHGLCKSGRWRTIMSYNHGCQPRAPHFSNPAVSYQGRPTGDAHVRHNARVIDETAQHIARFRRKFPPPYSIPLVMSADNSTHRGFVRVINRSPRRGTVRIDAIDDLGHRFGPAYLSLGARQTRQFDSVDLENGNASKGISRGVGNGAGNWRLNLSTSLDILTRTYVRTSDGFVTSIDELVAETEAGSKRYRVPTFSPGSNLRQKSRLRLANAGDTTARVTILGRDDEGEPPSGGRVRLTLGPGEARMLTAEDLEEGGSGLTGQFGAGSGRWQLSIVASEPLEVMNLLYGRRGKITNLSR